MAACLPACPAPIDLDSSAPLPDRSKDCGVSAENDAPFGRSLPDPRPPSGRIGRKQKHSANQCIGFLTYDWPFAIELSIRHQRNFLSTLPCFKESGLVGLIVSLPRCSGQQEESKNASDCRTQGHQGAAHASRRAGLRVVGKRRKTAWPSPRSLAASRSGVDGRRRFEACRASTESNGVAGCITGRIVGCITNCEQKADACAKGQSR